MAAARLTSPCPRRLTAALLAVFSAACAHQDLNCDRRDATPSAQSSSASVDQPPVPAASSAPVVPTPPSGHEPASWADAVRLEDWERADAQLQALPEQDQQRPEVRYVRARVALARQQFAVAATLLRDLESSLPELASDIAFHRAEAQLHAGPVEEAARYFASRSSVEELAKAASAFEQVGDSKRARETIDRAIRASRDRHDEHAVHAHQVRARLAEASGQTAQAVADLRFVARHAPYADQAEDAVETLRRLDPSQIPTAADRMARATRLADRGDPGQALDELDRVATSPGKTPSRAGLMMARARAVYATRDRYDEAAQMFEDASKLGGATAAEALYFAAKAWSRADQNARGLVLYLQVVRRFPRTPWAERASYQRARLLRLDGQWREAASAYAAYLSQYRRGASVREARFEHALSLLFAGRPKEARPRLEQLADAEDNRIDAAALRELVGVAAHASGDEVAAVEIWREVIAQDPLSWPALVAAARLQSNKQSPPPPILPGPSASPEPLEVPLPRIPKLLRDLGLEADAEAALADQEDALALPYGARAAQARCLLYRNLDRAHRTYRVGQRHAPAHLLASAPTSSTRWAWDCLFPTPYVAAVRDLESRHALPRGLLHAVMRQESAFNPDARSPVGALGLMQLMPGTAAKTAAQMQLPPPGNQVSAPAINLALGAGYLATLLAMFDRNLPLAVAAYNAGPKPIARWAASAKDVPIDLFVAQIPFRETRRYVWRVMGNYARYGYLDRGLDGIPSFELAMPRDLSIPDDAY